MTQKEMKFKGKVTIKHEKSNTNTIWGIQAQITFESVIYLQIKTDEHLKLKTFSYSNYRSYNQLYTKSWSPWFASVWKSNLYIYTHICTYVYIAYIFAVHRILDIEHTQYFCLGSSIYTYRLLSPPLSCSLWLFLKRIYANRATG